MTGAAGFIGYHLCEAHLAKGHYVLGVDSITRYHDSQLKRDRLSMLRRYARFMFLRLDLSDRSAVEALFQHGQFDCVFHLAAQAGTRFSLENPGAYVDSNVGAFINVLEGCRRNKIRHLIYASSSSVYGHPTKLPSDVTEAADRPLSLYAATKRAAELIAYTYSHLYGLNTTGLRLFSVYGPWGRPDMVVYRFTRAMLAGEPIDVYNHGHMRRDFTYIDDAVAGIVAAESRMKTATHNGRSAAPYRLYNLGTHQPVELFELVAALEEAWGVTAKVQYHGMQPGDVPETCADITASTRDLDFRPHTTLREGVSRFVEWYREYHGVRDSAAGLEAYGLNGAG